jgi:hypothetical protein
MEHLQHYIYELQDLKKAVDEVSGRWNGDEAGLLEERAHIADEISQKVEGILQLFKQLK